MPPFFSPALSPHALQDADPNSITTSIMMELRKLNLPTDFSQTKIKQGWGEEVCATLNNIAQMALKARRWKWDKPQFAREADVLDGALEEQQHMGRMGGSMSSTTAMEIIVGAGMDADEDDDIEEEQELLDGGVTAAPDAHALKGSASRGSAGPNTGTAGAAGPATMLESQVTSAEWKLELERVLPQLKVQLRADAKDWRNHLEHMRSNKTDIEKALTSTSVGQRGR